MKIVTAKQGTSEWFSARAGKCTGSRVADALCFLKSGKESAARENYRVQLVGEVLTGIPMSGGFFSPEMQWGVENEALARASYEMGRDVMVDDMGFALHDTIERFGGSPDGLVGEDGIIEIKCPKTATHLQWMLADVVPPEHEPQMASYLAITGRAWCDFISFDPRLPSRHQLFIKRMQRDEQRLREMEAGVVQFLAEVDALIDVLNRRNPGKEAQPKAKLHIDPSLLITDDDLPAWARVRVTT